MSDREVIREVKFITDQQPAAATMEDLLELLPPPPLSSRNAEEQDFFEGLKVLRAPSQGSKPAVAAKIFDYERIGEALLAQGYYRKPLQERTLMWTPTPGMGENNAGDDGKWHRKKADESWPIEAFTTEIDPADIEVKNVDGTHYAIHVPSGVTAEGKTKLRATTNVLARLEEMQELEEAERQETEQAS